MEPVFSLPILQSYPRRNDANLGSAENVSQIHPPPLQGGQNDGLETLSYGYGGYPEIFYFGQRPEYLPQVPVHLPGFDHPIIFMPTDRDYGPPALPTHTSTAHPPLSSPPSIPPASNGTRVMSISQPPSVFESSYGSFYGQFEPGERENRHTHGEHRRPLDLRAGITEWPNISKREICPICYDAQANVWLARCMHKFCRTCVASVQNAAMDNGRFRCPLCRDEKDVQDILGS